MNGCETHEIAISAIVDGALPSAEVPEALDHLLDCPSCRAFYRDSRALQRALARPAGAAGAAGGSAPLARVLPAADLAPDEADEADEVWRRIEQESTRRARRPAAWALRVAAGLLLAVAAVWGATQQAGRDGAREVVLGGESGRMNQARFVEIATEVLEADPRYRREMLRVMQAADEVAGPEAPVDYGRGSEDEGTGAEEGTGSRLAS